MVGLSVAVVLFGALTYPADTAGADQISSARSQIQALQDQVTAGAARIRDLTLAYEQANTNASALAQQVAADEARIAQLQAAETATRQAIRAEAIYSYTGGNAASPVTGSAAAGMASYNDPAVRAEYLQVAAGDITNTVDQYRVEQDQIATAKASLDAQMKASEAAAHQTEVAREAALAQAQNVQAQLDAVQNHLAQLEAEAAAQAAAARAAAARAAAAAAATQGLPVNGGLVSVVRSVISPSSGGAGGAGGVWLQLRECESGNNYQANTGNGYYGAYQFSESTWTGLGYPGRPDIEPPSMQDQAAQRLQARNGWGQWPACSAALGLH